MKKTAGRVTFVLMFMLILAHGMSTFAAGPKANLTVSKNGKIFKVTNGGKTYSFRYDWNTKKKRYTGFSRKKADRVAPANSLKLAMARENQRDHRDDFINLMQGIKLNNKIYGGMSLASFHRNIYKAWGKGHYGYWDSEQEKSVNIGTKKPSNSFVRKRCGNNGTGLYWIGKRGCLTISIPIRWNAGKKRAEVSPWIEIHGTETELTV